MAWLDDLNAEIVECRLCPRLVQWRQLVAKEKRKAFEHEDYWGRPVPVFGDPNADKLIVGLAPAAHGGNRTGRVFTGDRSGDWIFRALWKAGIANQPISAHRDDGLQLTGALVIAAALCAPPDNKPLPEEIRTCSRYFQALLRHRRFSSMLCLGGIAWIHAHRMLGAKPPKFGHGVINRFEGTKLVASYHPSQQNTFTGRLTEEMLDSAVREWLQP